MTKKVFITGEKYGRRVYDADDVEQAARLIIEDRIRDRYFDDAEEDEARRAMAEGRAYKFIFGRKHREYEGFEAAEIRRAQ